MSNSIREPTMLGKAPEGKPKMLKDSGKPRLPGPMGNMGGGLGGATRHLEKTVKGEAKMHRCKGE